MQSPFATSDSEEELVSYVKEVTRDCNVFRILVVGKSGSGKSTLVSEVGGMAERCNTVFDFDLEQANVSDFTPGVHDINAEITSPSNKSLSLHDSRGLESGSTDNLEVIQKFIAERRSSPLADQLHAIWYCVQVPVAGERPFEAGDIKLFQSLLESGNKVPVIVVFTKMDRLLFRETTRIKKLLLKEGYDKTVANTQAQQQAPSAVLEDYERHCVDVLKSSLVPKAWTAYCCVSNKQPESIINLIQMTKETLSQFDHLSLLWAITQMADVDLKVAESVKAGRKSYWNGIAASAIPLRGIRRVSTLTVLSRIHSDIVRIWNFNDPQGILLGANMRAMIRAMFIEPILTPQLEVGREGETGRAIASLAGMVLNPAEAAASAVIGTAMVLDDIALSTPAAARMMMAYVADLTLGMESLFWLLKPQKGASLTTDHVRTAYTTYRGSKNQQEVHHRIRDYIGDEEIMKSLKRENAAAKVAEIVASCRFNPTELFSEKGSSEQDRESSIGLAL